MKSRYDQLVDLMEQYDERGFAVGVGFVRGFPKFSTFTYAPEFLRRYEEEELAFEDNTLRVGMARDGIFTWQELEDAYGPSEAMTVARAFGVVDGICWATTVNGLKSIGSISLARPAIEANVPTEDIMAAFQLATIEAGHKMIDESLSSKSREYLELVAQGMSTTDIAIRLQISVPGVRKRQKTTQDHLGASNLAHAVAIAMACGGISSSRLV